MKESTLEGRCTLMVLFQWVSLEGEIQTRIQLVGCWVVCSYFEYVLQNFIVTVLKYKTLYSVTKFWYLWKSEGERRGRGGEEGERGNEEREEIKRERGRRKRRNKGKGKGTGKGREKPEEKKAQNQ